MPEELRERVITVLKTVYDPEIPVDIYELGLIYDLQVARGGEVTVKMTLTAPNCPVADSLPAQVKQRILTLEGVASAKVELVFEPPWDRSKMSEAALFALGFDMGPSVVPLSKIR
jgi:FeS assembly SUF system protein